MGTKISDRTAATLLTTLETDFMLLAREDTADLKIAISLLRTVLVRPTVEEESGTSRALDEDDDGKVIRFINAGAISVTVPTLMPKGWSVTIDRALGAGAVTIAGDGTVVMEGEKGSATSTTFVVADGGIAGVMEMTGSSPGLAKVYGSVS